MATVNGPASPEQKIRVIDQSLRCFVYGLIGAVPVLGGSLALQALRLFHRVMRETSESWRKFSISLYGMMGLSFLVIYYLLEFRWATLVTVFLLFSGLQGSILWNQCRTGDPRQNPARSYLFWGAILGWTGLFGSAAAFLLIFLEVFRRVYS